MSKLSIRLRKTQAESGHISRDVMLAERIEAAEEIEVLESQLSEYEGGDVITAMPIMIGEERCYLPVNAHGIVSALMKKQPKGKRNA